jgi:hypothetical protein
MKIKGFKIVYLALMLILFSIPMQGQIFKGMLIAGGNFSQINGDQVYGYKRVGVNTGVGVMAPLNNQRNFLISMEVLYNQIGAKESQDPFKYNTKLSYASIPLIFHYEDRRGGLTFGLGFQYSRLVQFNEDWGLPDTIKYMDRPVLPVNDFSRDDFSFVVDVRFRVWKKIKFNFRYQRSMAPIRKEVVYTNSLPPVHSDFASWKRNFYNDVLTFRVIYVINERSDSELDRRINRDQY